MTAPFWERKTLAEMDKAEWESLCDGCGLCCLLKLEDAFTGKRYYTGVACKLLDPHSCRCSDYPRRAELVPDCLDLSAMAPTDFDWLPASCGYRRLAEGRPLADWHPLVSGDPDSVHRAGISARGRTINEKHVHPDDIELHVVRWVEF